ncbi:MAG TPA: NAD-dependent epimerase/dehydratase family protein [Baekduia sp.]|nr:NAD-dependent epimerase/dehydratase family protein [Baekduia sp.]
MALPSHLLVTGASGFVGAAVARHALARGLRVTALVGPASRLGRLAAYARDLEVVRADVADPAALGAAVARARPDVCIHLAAVGAVVRDDDLGRLWAVNALAPGHLARALAGSGATRLVTAGSSSEYGTVDGPMDEAMACAPDDPYGVAKLAGGLLARAAARETGLQAAHLRLFSVYGPGEDPRRLVSSVAAALLAGRPVDLTPGEQVRDFVHVDDVAEALLHAATAPGIDGLTANVGTGVQTTVRALCEHLAALTGGRELLRFGALRYRDGERFSWRAATTRARDALGWSARIGLDEGLRSTIGALRADEVLAA